VWRWCCVVRRLSRRLSRSWLMSAVQWHVGVSMSRRLEGQQLWRCHGDGLWERPWWRQRFVLTDWLWLVVELWAITPRVRPGPIPLIPSLPHLLLYLLLSFTIAFFPFSHSLHLFSCFSIPSHSTRIVPLRLWAGCHRRWLNLALVVCVCWFCVVCIF